MNEEKEKFLYLYDSFSNDVLRLAFSYTKNIYDAEDIVQSVFIKLYKEINCGKLINKSWILTVTVNECKNYYKSIWRKKVVLNNDILNNEVDLSKSLKNDELAEAMLNLPLKYRTIIYLHYYEGYKVNEIAAILSIKTSTVKSLLFRGRNKLKKLIEEDMYE